MVCVLVAPEFRVAPRDITVELGDTSFLHCLVDGEPLPSVSWRKESNVIRTTERVSVLSNNTLR